jgi:hypothetical protein
MLTSSQVKELVLRVLEAVADEPIVLDALTVARSVLEHLDARDTRRVAAGLAVMAVHGRLPDEDAASWLERLRLELQFAESPGEAG